ncbi:MAG TPA: hypothetical protein DC006_03505 [Prevotellaceae bacterium]|nr:hypothetical protein [Prevotellaceae bacterium]
MVLRFYGLRFCGSMVLRFYGLRLYGYAVLWLYGFAVLRLHGYVWGADVQFYGQTGMWPKRHPCGDS